MLSDEERRTFNSAYDEWRFTPAERRTAILPIAMFAAGITYAQTWRSMESEKPERWQPCIVAVGNTVPHSVMTWDGARFYIGLSDKKYPFAVTHWMPLPLPPLREAGE